MHIIEVLDVIPPGSIGKGAAEWIMSTGLLLLADDRDDFVAFHFMHAETFSEALGVIHSIINLNLARNALNVRVTAVKALACNKLGDARGKAVHGIAVVIAPTVGLGSLL